MAKQFLTLFAGTFFISLFVLMMQFLWRYVDDLIGKGLSVGVLAQFFGYMGLMLVPQALPLAVLLASLITMGNLGENSELTAIKAAGISLMQSLRSLMFCVVIVTIGSFFFQNYVAPVAHMNMGRLLVSMKQKSPELEIPEGIFYDGIPNCNLYVQKKDLESGKLYGVMIYRMSNSFEDAAIILADSGMLQSTADKKHLMLTLHSGEWFENMRSQEMAGTANVPYRRETFLTKRILLDFDDGFNLADANLFSDNAMAKSLSMIYHSVDSLVGVQDSVGRALYRDVHSMYMKLPEVGKNDSLKAVSKASVSRCNIDSLLQSQNMEQNRNSYQNALTNVQMTSNSLEFYKAFAENEYYLIRSHQIEAVNKFTLSLICLIFFFIGAPLGAIIRKGGLGVPVIVSVLVFILFYILDNTGFRMARMGAWPIWLGKGLAPVVLISIAAFVTSKANKDSAVFNMDAYRTLVMRLLGLRLKRVVAMKEVIINQPEYTHDAELLMEITADIKQYSEERKLSKMPNVINVFFRYQPDHTIENITERLESVIDDLSNTRDRFVMDYLTRYPVVSEKAHTRPFESKRKNIIAFCILPLGVFLYFRMWRFRLRLHHDLKQICHINDMMIDRIAKMS